jgi:PAS domain S-box-containing protein
VALPWFDLESSFVSGSRNQWGMPVLHLSAQSVAKMKVKRYSNTSVSGEQKLQLPPGDKTFLAIDNPAIDEKSEQKQHHNEDIEQQQLAEELLASEQRFRITFEQAPIGMAHVGIDGRWLLVNQQLCNLLGYTQEELLQRTFHAVMLTEDLSTAFAYAQSMITGELQTYQHELRFVRKDDSQIWVNLTVTLVRDCTGMPLYFLALTEDLTDRKQAEQQRLLNQLKDQFIVNVNHELRTPLTQLYGYLELLTEYQGQLDSETQLQFIVQAKEGCQELILLINHVLDALAVTEELQPPSCELIALAPLLRDVLEQLDPQQEEADRVQLSVPEQLMVWANGQLLRQVFRNLLSNAFKYCPKPAAVIIRATQIDAGVQGPGSASEVCLCVQDAGPGIPPEELPLLFQKFVRLQRDLSGTVQGSGLGLYISKQFVEAMQGRIWVESAGIPGQGSRFFVALPCNPRALDEGHGSEQML